MPPKQSIISKMFEICSHQSFFKPTYSKCGSHVLRYNCGPMGSLLQENVKNEWTHAMLSNRDIDMFLKLSEISKQSGNNSNEIVECLVYLKEVGRSQLPCGVANIINYNFSDESDTKTSVVENNNVGECRNHVDARNMLVDNFVNSEVQLLPQEAQKTHKPQVKTTNKTIKIKKIKGTFADNIKNMEHSEGNVPDEKIIDTETVRHEKPLKNSATKSKSKFSKEFHTECSWLSAEVDPIADSHLLKKEHLHPSSYFNPLVGVILQSIILVHPRKGRELFYQWQRQRKIWWRKFSFSPGRFTVTDVVQDMQADALSPHLRGLLEDPLQSVHITAGFECGAQFLEIVQLCLLRDVHALNISDGSGKPVSPLCLVSSINLQAACLGFLGDCIEEEQCVPQDTNVALRLHRRLAPYQCSVVCDTKDLPSDDLLQLARYMWGVLRGMGVSTLHLPQVHTHSVDEHFKELDLIGVPYTLVLNEDSLKCGMLQIRNRDTTLMEQVHVTDVSDYIVKLSKSY